MKTRSAGVFVIVLFGLLAADCFAAENIPLENYGRLPAVASMAISPSGARIAFHRMDETVDAIFMVERQSGEVIGVVDGSETKIRDIVFLDEDRLILFAEESEHVKKIGRKLEISGSFIFDRRTNTLSALLEKSGLVYPLQTGVGQIVGHDAKRDALIMPAYIGKVSGTPATYGLMEVTPDKPDGHLLTRGTEDTVGWFVDDKGQIIAEEDFDPDSHRRRIWGRNGSKRVLVYDPGRDGPSYSIVGLGERKNLVVVSTRPAGSDFNVYYEMNLDDGSVGAPLFKRDDTNVEMPLVDLGRHVYGVQYSGFMPTYEFFDAELTARVQAVQAAVKNTAAYLVDWTPDFEFLLFRLSGGWTSGAYVLVGPDSPTPKLLAAEREDIPAAAVVPTTISSYAARDGMEIPALVTVRADIKEAGNAPLVVIPHGGPAAYDHFEFDWMAQYFASRGMVVLQPQFRGSTGFGASLRRAGIGQWGGTMSTDLDDGVQHLVDAGLVNPQRVCMVGASYGGYAALAAGAFSKFDYKCLVAIAGVSDLPRMLITEREKYGDDSRQVAYWQDELNNQGKRDQALDGISPVNFAEKFRSPVLLLHGKDDAVVPLDQSLRMNKALERANKPVQMIKLKGEDHYLSSSETRIETLRSVAKFLETNL
ncbi:MAG TPA: prolyl oligopeptidase family serine peptidase [Woeseiaceae bacterium]|nr:prolyl oligopeptidase family serine peptidase [Woeseiaceae bacterium]